MTQYNIGDMVWFKVFGYKYAGKIISIRGKVYDIETPQANFGVKREDILGLR